jgi:hypothetical protein
MDVSWSEAQRAETNVIARGGDRAATLWVIRYTHSSKIFQRVCVPFYFVSVGSLKNMYLMYLLLYLLLSSRGRRCGRLRSRQNSAALRFFAHIHRPYSRRCRVGCKVVDAGSSLRAIAFAPKLRCAPFFRSHPSPLLTPLSRRLRLSSRMPTTAKPSRSLFTKKGRRAEVGAMDVSWSEAQRAETNVIARGGDHAATLWVIRYTHSSKTFQRVCVPFYFVSVGSLKNMYLMYLLLYLLLSTLGRRCGRLRSRQNSAALRFDTHIHRPYSRRCRVGCGCRRACRRQRSPPF